VIARVSNIALVSIGGLLTKASGQAAADFVGASRLVSCESRDSNGAVQYPFGQGVVGQLLYDARDNMSAMLMNPDRPAFASKDPRRGTDKEVRAAFDGFAAYSAPTP